LPQADDAAGEFEQAEVKVDSYLVADPEAFELVKPGEGSLDDHLVLPRPDPSPCGHKRSAPEESRTEIETLAR